MLTHGSGRRGRRPERTVEPVPDLAKLLPSLGRPCSAQGLVLGRLEQRAEDLRARAGGSARLVRGGRERGGREGKARGAPRDAGRRCCPARACPQRSRDCERKQLKQVRCCRCGELSELADSRAGHVAVAPLARKVEPVKALQVCVRHDARVSLPFCSPSDAPAPPDESESPPPWSPRSACPASCPETLLSQSVRVPNWS